MKMNPFAAIFTAAFAASALSASAQTGGGEGRTSTADLAKAAALPMPVGLPPLGPTPPVLLPPFVQKTLPNGLRVVVFEDHKQPAVWMRLALPAGTIRDPKNKTGVAQMTAALLDKGTTTRTEDQIADIVDTLGATLGAGAGADNFSVSANGLSSQTATLLDLMADITLRPAFPQADVDRYKTQAASGITSALAQPATVADAALARLVYGSHPYGNFATGTLETVRSLTRNDAQTFHDTYFAPNQAVLFFAGDITPAQAEAAAIKAFGGWAKKDVPALPVPPQMNAASATKPRITIIDRPGSSQTEVRIGLLTPGYRDPKRITANVSAAVLGLGQFESRLTKEVRVKRGLTYGIGSTFSRQNQAGEFYVSTFTKNESTGEALKIIYEEIAKLAQTPPGNDELTDRKSFLSGTFALTLATPDGILGRLIPAVLNGNGPTDLTMLPREIAAVTPQAVQETLKGITPGKTQIVLVGDAKAIEPQVASMGTVTVIAQSDLNLQSPTLKADTPLVAATPAAAPASAEDAAQGKALLDATVKAHGGEAFLALKSVKATATGQLTPPGQGGLTVPIDSAVITTANPDKARLELTTGFGAVIIGAPGGGKGGWAQFGGQVQEQPASASGGFGDPTTILRVAANNKYAVRALPNPTEKTADGKALHAFEVTTDKNHTLTLFVEAGTNLLRRVDGKEGPVTSRTNLSDYKNAGNGVMLPGKVQSLVNGEEVLTLTFGTFELNVPAPDTLFEKPKG